MKAAQGSLALALFLAPLQASNITGLSNTPDPFDNKAAPTANQTSITLTSDASDLKTIAIINLAGDSILRRIYSDKSQNPAAQIWTGIRDAIPAYAVPDTLAYGTYRIRTNAGIDLQYNTKAQGTGLILDDVYDVAADADGNLYFCNQPSGIVYKIDTTGKVLVRIVLADAPLNLSGTQIWGIAIDATNNIYLSDDQGAGSRIIKLNASTNYTTATAPWELTAVSNNPRGMGSYNNNIWIADEGAGRIREFDSTGTRLRNVAVANCLDVAVDATYYYAVETNGTDEVRKHQRSNDALATSWQAIPTDAAGVPMSISVNSSYVVVSGESADRVYRTTLTGGSSTQVGTGPGTGNGQFDAPEGVVLIPGTASLAVVDRINKRIQTFDAATPAYDTALSNDPSSLLDPRDADADRDGNVFTPVAALGMVKKFDENGIYVTSFGAPGSGNGQLNNPRGICVDDSGHVYVGDYGNNRVQRFTKVSETIYVYAWTYTVSVPLGMTYGADGKIYVASLPSANTVDLYKINANGTLLDVITDADIQNNPGGVTISSVTDVAVDYAHNVWLCDDQTGDVYKGTRLDGVENPGSYSWVRIRRDNEDWNGLAVDRYGNQVLSDVNGNNRIWITGTDGTVMYNYNPGTGSANDQVNNPYGITFTKDYSAVWIADASNNRLVKKLYVHTDTRDELVTLGNAAGAPELAGVSYRRSSDDSALTTPLGSTHNTGTETGVTVSVSFSEAMATSYSPTVKLVDINNNQHTVAARSGAGYSNGWLTAQTNVWEGQLDIPTGNDGLARVYLKDPRDAGGDTIAPNPNDSFTVTLDTETPIPLINSPAHNGATTENIIQVTGTAEPLATLACRNYTAASGGSLISEQTNIAVDSNGNWTANNISLQLGANYLTAVATDEALNVSAYAEPRVKVTRTNVLPGTIAISPGAEVFRGDSNQWTLTYTAASALSDNTHLKVRIQNDWTDPQINSSAQAGYVSVTPGAGTTLDATPLDIVSTDTVRVNITSMTNGTTFQLKYGGAVEAAYAKVGSSAAIGNNAFYANLVDTTAVAPPSIYVRGRPVKTSRTDQMPATTFVGQSDLLAMHLNFDNTAGLENKKITKITLRVEKSGGTAVAGNSRLTLVKIKDASATYGSAVPGSSSSVVLTLSTPFTVAAGTGASVEVRVNVKNDATLVDSTLRISLVDSTQVKASEAGTGDSVGVQALAGNPYPQVSGTATLTAATTPDSLNVSALAVIPSTVGEREREAPGLRVRLQNPTPAGANDIKITRFEFTMAPSNPSSTVAKKILRRKGQSTNLYSSTSIETSNPMIFDLEFTPIYIAQGVDDTIDVMFDAAAAPSSPLQFTLSAASAVTAKDAISGNTITVKGTFPMSSASATVTNNTNPPSGKTIDGSRADWTQPAELIETYGNGTDSFFTAWDNNNLYFLWKGTDFSTAGDLFIYLQTKSGGSNTTWNYTSYGTHSISTGFGGADYLFYYDNSGAKGLRDGSASYAGLTFNGEVSASGAVTEIRIPLSNLGSPSSFKVIPLVQGESNATIGKVMPYDRVGEFVKNPTGTASQNLISWITLDSLTGFSATPRTQAVLDTGSANQPDWSFDAGGGDPILGLTVGYDLVYVSIGGASPGVAAVRYSDGVQLWRYATGANAPTPAVYFWNGTYDIVVFGAGNNLYILEDQLASVNAISGTPIAIGAAVGTPILSGDLADSNVYFIDGSSQLQKYLYSTGASAGAPFPVAVANSNRLAGMVVNGTDLYIPCTDGNLKLYTTAGAAGNSLDLGPSIGEDLAINETDGKIYAAPNDNYLWSLPATLAASNWSINLGATTQTAPFNDPNDLARVYVGAGINLKRLTDNGASATVNWTYVATDVASSNPVVFDSTVYFGGDDRRLFAVNASTGANRVGWPSTPLTDKTNVRVAVDGFYSIVYFGTEGGKVYRYAAE